MAGSRGLQESGAFAAAGRARFVRRLKKSDHNSEAIEEISTALKRICRDTARIR
jgi:hypothetical protein